VGGLSELPCSRVRSRGRCAVLGIAVAGSAVRTAVNAAMPTDVIVQRVCDFIGVLL
jgi:hypothetical protein